MQPQDPVVLKRISPALSPLLSLILFPLPLLFSPSVPLPLSLCLVPSLHPRCRVQGAEVEVAGAQRERRCGLPGSALRAVVAAETATACISEASPGALSPALSCILSGSSQGSLPPRTGFILGRTRPTAWQITRDARVFPSRTQRPEQACLLPGILAGSSSSQGLCWGWNW